MASPVSVLFVTVDTNLPNFVWSCCPEQCFFVCFFFAFCFFFFNYNVVTEAQLFICISLDLAERLHLLPECVRPSRLKQSKDIDLILHMSRGTEVYSAFVMT